MKIDRAIGECRELEFFYYSPKGESDRCIEPYYLIFRWANWYVWGWCRRRQDFRLFRLNRAERKTVTCGQTAYRKDGNKT